MCVIGPYALSDPVVAGKSFFVWLRGSRFKVLPHTLVVTAPPFMCVCGHEEKKVGAASALKEECTNASKESAVLSSVFQAQATSTSCIPTHRLHLPDPDVCLSSSIGSTLTSSASSFWKNPPQSESFFPILFLLLHGPPPPPTADPPNAVWTMPRHLVAREG